VKGLDVLFINGEYALVEVYGHIQLGHLASFEGLGGIIVLFHAVLDEPVDLRRNLCVEIAQVQQGVDITRRQLVGGVKLLVGPDIFLLLQIGHAVLIVAVKIIFPVVLLNIVGQSFGLFIILRLFGIIAGLRIIQLPADGALGITGLYMNW
jgi:hypothetical protein